MSRVAKLLAVCLTLLLGACAAPTGPDDASRETDLGQMRAALASSVAAWNRGDLPGHLAIYDDSVEMMTKTGPRSGIAAIETAFRATYFLGDRPKQALRMEQVSIRPLTNGAALMTGRFVLSGGGEDDKSGWFTLVWVQTATGWKVVHDHTS